MTAVLSDSRSGRAVLETALQFAGGETERVSVLLFPEHGQDVDALRALYRDFLPGEPGHVRSISAGDFKDLAVTHRTLMSTMLLAPANELMMRDQSLKFLLAQVRCPVCLVARY